MKFLVSQLGYLLDQREARRNLAGLSKYIARACVAPVDAPFSLPNSSEGGHATQSCSAIEA